MNRQAILVELVARKERCRRALEDPGTSELLKARVLVPELHIYLLAEEGYRSLEKSGKQDLLSTVPAKIAAPPTD